MRRGFNVIELIFTIVLIGILSMAGYMMIPDNRLQQAADSIISNLKYTKMLAQTDDRYYTMPDSSMPNSVNLNKQMENWKKGMWQFQIHLKGSNAEGSYSIYADTGRTSNSTNFDGRPMSGDLIAKDPINMSCLSGYTMSNLPKECENNIAREVKLAETFGISKIEITTTNCVKESDATRIFFDNKGLPYCGKNPVRMTAPTKIVLSKGRQTATICISPNGLIYGSNNNNSC